MFKNSERFVVARSYERNEHGLKAKVEVEIRGEGLLDRSFRSKGEAIDWLKREGYTKDEINKFVRFVHS